MIEKELERLRDHIQKQNTFFDNGFYNVRLDDYSGMIIGTGNSEKFCVGINDEFGKYFYIRIDPEVRYSESKSRISDSMRILDVSLRSFLVAVVDNARPTILLTRLVNTLINYSERIKVNRSFTSEPAIQKELSKLPANEIQFVLQNLGIKEVVWIEFDYVLTFAELKEPCLTNLCDIFYE